MCRSMAVVSRKYTPQVGHGTPEVWLGLGMIGVRAESSGIVRVGCMCVHQLLCLPFVKGSSWAS